jgi:hypothetical protein
MLLNFVLQEIEEILKDEYEKDFETCHSLFVIILTRGDRHGIYGTHGGLFEGRHGREHVVVGFTTTYAINEYHHYGCEFESRSW